MESDIALARHVTFVHQFKKNPELDFEPFDPKFLKLYISQVTSLKGKGECGPLLSQCTDFQSIIVVNTCVFSGEFAVVWRSKEAEP